MLDAVFDPKSFEEDDEVSEVFYEVVIAIVCFDVAKEDYVVGEIVRAVRLRKDGYCGGECRIVRGEANAIAILLVGQIGRLGAEFIGEIVLYIGECISHTLVGIEGLLRCVVYRFFFVL